MAAVALPAAARRPAVPPLLARLGAFAGLSLFGALHWAELVAPKQQVRLAVMTLAAVGLGAVLAWTRPRPGRPGRLRDMVAGIAILAAAATMLLAAGIPPALLGPRGWADLAAGLAGGIGGMPTASVPYHGVDGWVQATILLSGGVLLGTAAALAFWPRTRARPPGLGHPLLAALALGLVYAIPVVERNPGLPFLGGAVFAVLLGAFLWLERLEREHLSLAAALVAVAAFAGVAVAPGLDASRPWLDYEHLATSIAEGHGTTFSWDHQYGPLDWPRDGREVLRVTARRAAYWKTEVLEDFDGVRWRHSHVLPPSASDTEIARDHQDWLQTVTVSVRALRSHQFVGAGTTLAVDRSPRKVLGSSPGTFVTGIEPLRRGDSYRATVYTPRPDALEMASAGHDYPPFLDRYLSIEMPAVPAASYRPHAGGPAQEIHFSRWGSRWPPLTVRGATVAPTEDRVLRHSGYARTYALVLRLRRRSTSPYEFVRRIQRHLANGFRYSESPPPRELPLASFLFTDRIGYCQQFSGAMALLLRMGGVPARVATGFTPGTFSAKRGDYAVHDVDAHSWVEVYFPRIGWVPFDPTPTVAPARAQAAGDPVSFPSGGGGPSGNAAGGRLSGPRGSVEAGGGGAGGWVAIPLLIVAGALALAATLALAVLALIRRRALRAELAVTRELPLAELRLALRRTGRTPDPAVTLAHLEAALGGGATSFVRALRLRRYAGEGSGPSLHERAALRRELAAGLGLAGRLRAWLALPPLGRRRRRTYTDG